MPLGALLGGLAGAAIGSFIPGVGTMAGWGAGTALGAGFDSSRGQQETNQTNIDLAMMNNQWNANEAEKNRLFQERMSSTSWQRGVQDMQAAGLNPMLAYSQGGASSPAGSMATGTPVRVENSAAVGISSAAQQAQAVAAAQSILSSQAQIEKTKADTEYVKSTTLDQALNSAAKLADIKATLAGAAKTEEQVPGERAKSQTDLARMRAELGMDDFDTINSGFAADVRRRKAEALGAEADVARTQMQTRLLGLDVPRAKVESDFYSGSLGALSPEVRMLLNVLGAAKQGASVMSILKGK